MIEIFRKEGWQLNPNDKVVNSILKRIEANNGECPCHNESKEKKCPCSDYRENNTCHCGLYTCIHSINITDTNIHIVDSYTIYKKEWNQILNTLRYCYINNSVLLNRSNKSLTNEWALHNFLYSVGLFKSHTKDVDLNYPQKWYISLIYNVFGFLVKPFCK